MKVNRYRSVPRNNGQTTEAYAATNAKEYFAEATEAYFGTNDLSFRARRAQEARPRDVSLASEAVASCCAGLKIKSRSHAYTYYVL
jgi:hypothetical protein